MYIYIHIYMQKTYMLEYIQTYMHVYIHTDHMSLSTYKYIHPNTYNYIPTYMDTSHRLLVQQLAM